MQYFDLQHSLQLADFITPHLTLADLSAQEWYLAKVRVDYDCLNPNTTLEGQAVLRSNAQLQIELAWSIHDTGHELQVLFKGIETVADAESFILLKGARLYDAEQHRLSTQALSLWIDGTLLPMLPNIRREIKARLNVWDYVQYDG